VVYEVDPHSCHISIMENCAWGIGMESRRCAEHGLSFLPEFWTMICSVGAAGDLTLTWDSESESDSGSASAPGAQIDSSEMQIQG
jgi:hypothetical protein